MIEEEIQENVKSFMHRMDYLDDYKTFSCVGINSEVVVQHLDNNDKVVDETVEGHILCLDIENQSFRKVQEFCKEMYDVYFLFESSTDSYHVVNPVVRGFEETYDRMKAIEMEEDNHADIGHDRGDWVLRFTDKKNKPCPRLVDSRALRNNNKTFSRPHLRYIETLHDSYHAKIALNNPTVGNTLRTVKYWTFR